MANFRDHLRSFREDILNVKDTLRGSKKEARAERDKKSAIVSLEQYVTWSQGPNAPYVTPDIHLFRLPREIRDQIWEFVFGGHTIHIVNPSIHKVTHVICSAPLSDVLAYAMYPYDNPDKTYWDAYRSKLPPGQRLVDYGARDRRHYYHDFRHNSCFAKAWPLAKAGKALDSQSQEDVLREQVRDAQLCLKAMRTCRAIYAEIFRIFWTQNTYLFSKSRTAHDFTTTRTKMQRDFIRHLSLKPEQYIAFASIDGTPLQASSAWPSCHSEFFETIANLPNLSSVCLAATYHMTLADAESIWCRGELQVTRHGKVAIEIVDQLVVKPSLTFFYPKVTRVCIVLAKDGGGGTYRYDYCDEIKQDLEMLLHKRVMANKVQPGRPGRERNDLDGTTRGTLDLRKGRLQERKAEFEKWKREHLET